MAALGFGLAADARIGGPPASAGRARCGRCRPPERRPLPDRAPYAASVLIHDAGDLRVRALVAVPRRRVPRQGFPVVVACHGFHPDPRRYGFTAGGENSRPGDCYRDVPRWFTAEGFVVVMPDYRGHNDSGGHADPGDPAAPVGYADDVVALLGSLGPVSEVDAGRVFLWGHSMGAEVVLRVLARSAAPVRTVAEAHEPRARRAATGAREPRVLGASLWSIAGRPPEPVRLDVPVLLQHAIADPVAPSALATQVAASIEALGKLRGLELSPGDAHFFQGAQAARAVRRDLDFFAERMSMAASA